MVAMYNVYSAVQREPIHALRADNSFLEKQMHDLQTRLSEVEKENDHLKADLQHALRDTTEVLDPPRVVIRPRAHGACERMG